MNDNAPSRTCFVIMGFGKKTDPELGITYDLDKTYKNIIRPAVKSANFKCVRADEIKDSGLIDKSMYTLLMQADLVVADITTFNPNAVYELGVRHGVKPYSTVILKVKEGKTPFDLNHNRIFMYSHLGEDIGADEAERCKSELTKLINEITNNPKTDSPLYEYINEIQAPVLPESEYQQVFDELSKKEEAIFALVEKAKSHISNSEFIQACQYWEKASEKIPSEPYFIQQWALCKYKSDTGNLKNLTDALCIINKLSIDDQNTNDPETLGICGAIYKTMWRLTQDTSCLDRAIEIYGKCFKITNNYYNGENYALCLDEKSVNTEDKDEIIYCKFEAKKTKTQILQDLNKLIDSDDFNNISNKKWIFSTLSNLYLSLGSLENAKKNEQLFLNETPAKWEIDSFNETKGLIQSTNKSN